MKKTLKLKLTPVRSITTKGEIRRIERAIATPAGQTGPRTYVAMSRVGGKDAKYRVLAVGMLKDVKATINEAAASVEETGRYWSWTREDLENLRLYGPLDVPPDVPTQTFESRSTCGLCYHDFTSELWCPTDGAAGELLSVERSDIVSIQLAVTYRSAGGLKTVPIPLPPTTDTITIGDVSARSYITEHYPTGDAPLYHAEVPSGPVRAPAATSTRMRKR